MFLQCFRTCVMTIAAKLARLRCGFRVGGWGLGEPFQNILSQWMLLLLKILY